MSKIFAVLSFVLVVAFSSFAFAQGKGTATTQVQGWDEFLATHEKVIANATRFVEVAKESSVLLSELEASEKKRLLYELEKAIKSTENSVREYEESRREMKKSFENYFKK